MTLLRKAEPIGLEDTCMDYRLKELEIKRDKQIAELKSTLENNHKNEMNRLQIQIEEEKKVLLEKNKIEKNELEKIIIELKKNK